MHPMHDHRRSAELRTRDRRHERGAALLVAVLFLALMGVIGLASMETVTRDRQVAGYQSRAQTSLYAAEAGVNFALALIRRDAQGLASGGEGALEAYNPSETPGGVPPQFPDLANAEVLGTSFPPPGPPRFYMDPDARDPNDMAAPPQAIRYIGRGGPCPGWIMSAGVGSVQWAEALWDIRVRGDNPGGTEVDIQATGSNCHPYN
ncbi:MAG: pilus assembly PilX N-terminal domain-containing protein [Myxococcota bacterium]|nr:pilus assembly PilX N-terminal domain-containing protein [Myxococcota bacterium]